MVGDALREFRGILTGVPDLRYRPVTGRKQRGRCDADRRWRSPAVARWPQRRRTPRRQSRCWRRLAFELAICGSFDNLLEGVIDGAGAVLIAEEALSAPHITALHGVLTRAAAVVRPAGRRADAARRRLSRHRPKRFGCWAMSRSSSGPFACRRWSPPYGARCGRANGSIRFASIWPNAPGRRPRLRLADRRKDEFLATLGHELRNPLAPLLTAVELLKTAGAAEPVATRLRPVMERQINHLVRLVNDLLEVSRITRGLIEVRREPIDLVNVAQCRGRRQQADSRLRGTFTSRLICRATRSSSMAIPFG